MFCKPPVNVAVSGKPLVNLPAQQTYLMRLSMQIHDLKQRTDCITIWTRGHRTASHEFRIMQMADC
jgi:hypothetical protein